MDQAVKLKPVIKSKFISHGTLGSHDLERTRKFYEEFLGLEVVKTSPISMMVRLGSDLGMIKDIDRRTINELFIITQPAHLQKLENKKISSQERDLKRAELIRKKLNLL